MRSIFNISKTVLYMFIFMLISQVVRGQNIVAPFTVSADSLETASFDLLIYGKGIHEDALQVSLMTNPAFGGKWEQVERCKAEISHNGQFLILDSLDKALYMGQDIRENYISMRLESTATREILISAVYVLPHGIWKGTVSINTMADLIEESPHELKDLSLAVHVRPQSYVLEPGAGWIEHIEANVRHHKPGVREVEWLDIIF
ncbi:MAG: hypothetical protein ACLFN1_01445 [Bacteroidales bacterium]